MAKAKKPYAPPFPLVEIDWDDAASKDDTWVALADLDESAPEKVRTVGYLVKETDKVYVVAGSVANEDIEDETVGNTMIIPKGMVTSFRRVRLETVKPKPKKRQHATSLTPAGATEPARDHGGAGKDGK